LDGRGGLDEKDGALGGVLAALGGVAAVVEADGEDVGGDEGREELAGRDGAIGHRKVGEDIAGDFASGAIGLEGGVGGAGGGEVADEAHGVRKRLRADGAMRQRRCARV